MKLFTTLGLIIITGFILIGCQIEQTSHTNSDDNLSIYTSIYPIQYIIKRIGGETINTSTVFPPGVDAHSYEPTTKTMTQLAKSDAFIYMGAGMEGFSSSMADALANEHVRLLELGQYEELFSKSEDYQDKHAHTEDSHDHQHHDEHGDIHSEEDQQGHEEHNHADEKETHHSHDGHNHGDLDPHIWIDPLRMINMAEILLHFLIEMNPSERLLYEENFNALKEDLLELDEDFQTTLEQKTQKKILISHAAYGYWEERYGIKQLAINGVSSTSEPSQKDLVRIIEQARESNLEYIIFEQNTSSKLSNIIKDYLHVQIITIHNLAVLTEVDIKKNEDYLTLMRRNLKVLDQATH